MKLNFVSTVENIKMRFLFIIYNFGKEICIPFGEENQIDVLSSAGVSIGYPKADIGLPTIKLFKSANKNPETAN